jgi:translation initiation factor IF-1
MSKEDTITMSGEIIDCMPNATFKVKLKDNDHVVLCHISGKMRRFNIKILLGDTVDVELSTYDLSKGRISFRHK